MEKRPKLLIVYEKPTAEERTSKKQFFSDNHVFYSKFFAEEMSINDIAYMYLFPNKNVDPKAHYYSTINRLKPRCILLVGTVVLKEITRRTGVTNLEGQLITKLSFPEGIPVAITDARQKIKDLKAIADTMKPEVYKSKLKALKEKLVKAKEAPLVTCIRNPRSVMMANRSANLEYMAFIIKKIVKFATKWEKQNYDGNYVLVDNKEKMDWFAEEILKHKEVAVDIETATLGIKDKNSRVLCISFTWEKNQAAVIPWDPNDFPLKGSVKEYIKEATKIILEESNIKWITHNGKFDCSYLRSNGVKIPYPYFDTLIGHYIAITEEKGTHGLKRLSWLYTNKGGYEDCLEDLKKERKKVCAKYLKDYEKLEAGDPAAAEDYKNSIPELKAYIDTGLNFGSYAYIPFNMLWKYNAIDTVVTWDLYLKLKKRVDKNPNYKWLMYKLYMRSVRVFGEMEEYGALIDTDYVRKKKKKYKKKVDKLVKKLFKHKSIKQVEDIYYNREHRIWSREKSEKEKAYNKMLKAHKVLEDKYTPQIEALKDKRCSLPRNERQAITKKIAEVKKEWSTEKKTVTRVYPFKKVEPDRSNFKFNINSTDQLRTLFFTVLELKPYKTTANEDLTIFTTNQIKEREEDDKYSTDIHSLNYLSSQHDMPQLLLKYRQVFKLYNTYIKPAEGWIGRDGKIHPTHMLHGTETGRISCRNPNLQNIPTDDKVIKKFFIPTDPKGYIVQFDFSQAELRILTVYSREPFLIKAYKENKDIHREVAALLNDKPVDKITDDERSKAKTINFGIVYGMGPPALAAATGMDQEEAKDFIFTYFDRLPGVSLWKRSMITFAQNNRYVETIFGFRRRLYNILHEIAEERSKDERRAGNTPIQGTASQYAMYCLCLVYDEFKKKFKSRPFITVHDSIVVDTYEDELADVIETGLSIMEKKHFKWQIVDMKADAEIGSSWGSMHKLEDILNDDKKFTKDKGEN